ncbi:MAG: fumarylacetoacetate hydrolase family protein [Desulfobacterales bacterium]|nr:MAG: fumarylacetoacetate hydrolase family protein [Desulfobacterales bacterium]
MKIIRFLDEQERICYGHRYEGGIATLLEGQLPEELKDTGKKIAVKKLLAPIAPTAILCIGLNYHQHAEETGFEIPKYPALFLKNPAALNHPADPIVLPATCIDPPQVDYEAELAVVIGKPAKNVSVTEALSYVKGFTLANDISARRWQKHAGAGQFARSKSFDTFCPLGPVLVTPDEIPDPQKIQLRCMLNGEIMQEAHTSDMIFSVAEIITYLSTDMTLLPGSVILTGTPSGVGYTRNPPVFLKPGDVVKVSASDIGTLKNPVISESTVVREMGDLNFRP